LQDEYCQFDRGFVVSGVSLITYSHRQADAGQRIGALNQRPGTFRNIVLIDSVEKH